MKNQNALISVIIPVYNVEKYLRKCIDSVVEQTYKNLEIILIDDGSPDNCGKICDEYAAKDNRIKVIHQTNQGVSAARNAGLDAAQGEYIGFVDSDDYIKPEMYQTLLSVALQTQADITMCGQIVLRPNEKELVKFPHEKMYIYPNNITWLNDLMTYPFATHVIWNKLFKKQRIGKIHFNQLSGSGEDFEFLLDFLNNPLHVVYIPQPLYYYVFRENSVTHQKVIRFFNNQYSAWKRAIKIARKIHNREHSSSNQENMMCLNEVYKKKLIPIAFKLAVFIILFDTNKEYNKKLRELRYIFHLLQQSSIRFSLNTKNRIWIYCFGKFPSTTITILSLPGLKQLLSFYILHR